ncbi:MAG: glycosyltransferase family 4 protein [Planctomycetes bacterium]|nr:glycosyltransferase family 4 protein [Planctomycetota bacterium]
MPAPAPVKVLHLSAADIMLYPILREQLVSLRDLGYEVHTASIDGPLARRLRDEDRFPWTALPLTRAVAPWRDWKAVCWIEAFLREQKFTIVHTHTPKGNLIGQWAARRAGVPIVLQTLHGFYFHDRMPAAKRRLWIALERFSARHSDHILCQNPEDVATALREGIAREGQIELLGNGIGLDRYRPGLLGTDERAAYRERLGLPPDALVVGICGRFVAEKGFPEFLEAGRRLFERFPKLHLLAVGHKLESERAEDRWEPSQAQMPPGRLTVLYDRDDMPQLYACMDIHALPSHREGFPRVLMEGAASGLAQVATKIRGCRQCIAEGETGYLVAVNDANALAEALAKLLGGATLRETLGRAARAKAEREFDQRKVFEIVSDAYARLLERKGLQGPARGGG